MRKMMLFSAITSAGWVILFGMRIFVIGFAERKNGRKIAIKNGATTFAVTPLNLAELGLCVGCNGLGFYLIFCFK